VLSLESLEERSLLAWSAIGPMPQNNPAASSTPGNMAGVVFALADSYQRYLRKESLFLGSAGGLYMKDPTGTDPWKLVSPGPGAVEDTKGNAVPLERTAGINTVASVTASPFVSGDDKATVYAGTGQPSQGAGAGILKSDDGGVSFQLINTPSAQSAFTGKAVVGLLNVSNYYWGSHGLYAAVRPVMNGPNGLRYGQDGLYVNDGGIFKSTDGGLTWKRLNGFQGAADGPFSEPLYEAPPKAILPEDINYVSFNPHVSGQPNKTRLIATAAPYGGFQTAAFKEINAKNTGIWYSDDGGLTWMRFNNTWIDPDDTQRIRIAVSHSFREGIRDADTIYAVVSNRNNEISKVIRSTDGGYTWATMSAKSLDSLQKAVGKDQTWWDLAIETSDKDPNVLYVGATGLAVTTTARAWANGLGVFSASWKQLDNATSGKRPAHADQQTILVPPGGYGKLAYDGTDGGVWKVTTAPRVGWEGLNGTTLNTNQIYSAAAYNYPANSVYVEGSGDNGYARKVGVVGTSWNKLAPYWGDGGPVVFTQKGDAFAADWGGNERWYLFSPRASLGKTWETLAGANTNGDGLPMRGTAVEPLPEVPPWVLTPDNTALLLGSEKGVWKRTISKDDPGGTGWVPLQSATNGMQPSEVSAIFAVSNDVFYAAKANGALYRSTNGGGNWTFVKRVADAPWGEHKVTGLFVEKGVDSDHDIVYVTAQQYATADGGGRVYRSDDGGKTFEDISKHPDDPDALTLPDGPVYALAVDTNDATYGPGAQVRPIYVGTDLGVYVTVDNGQNWKRFEGATGTTKLPVVKVDSLQLFNAKSQLVVGTYGMGVWTTDLPARRGAGAVGVLDSGLTLGTFADTGGAGSYAVSIDWGDGTAVDTTTGAVTTSGGLYTVTGGHTFSTPGEYAVTATVTWGGQTTAFTDDFVVSPAAISGTSTTLTASAFSALSSTAVATYTSPSSSLTDFTASIDWGDGTSSPGAIAYSGGTYTVSGDHTYTNAGAFTVTTNINSIYGPSALVSSTATISGTVSATSVPVSATQGTSTGSVTVVTFTATTSGPFTASIDWGDGQQSTGTVTPDGSGGYIVTGSNTFATTTQDSALPLTVRIFDNGTLASVVTSETSVASQPLTGTGLALSAAQGADLSGVLARFSDPTPSPASAYTASIDWGDGSSAEDGTVIAEPGSTFAVSGSHAYSHPGNYGITVTVDGPNDSETFASTVSVARAAPVVSSVGPAWGPTQGGQAVTINGDNLFDATAVSFGGTAAVAFTVNDDGSITAITPALSAGTVDITVTTPYSTSSTSSADQYTATSGAAPTVTGLGTTSGSTGGGNTITIAGTGLASATAVSFGAVQATAFTIVSDTSISVVVPEQLSGTVDVTVTTAFGTSSTSSADQYAYSGTAPSVTGLSEQSGPAAGGNTLAILGTNLNSATSVSFGSTSTTDFTVISSGEILVTVPSLSAGTYDVTVTTAYGTSSTSSADQFTAVSAPTVSSLGTTSGPTGGGTSVTITGTGFTNAWQVLFGGQPAAFTINSSTSITATAPASSSAGAVDVVVMADGGASATSSADQFTFNATAPTVSALSASQGPTIGGTQVILTGSSFNGATAVTFGSTAATSFTVDSPTQITATAPAGTAGSVHVSVTTPFGTSSTSSADLFTFANAAPPLVSAIGTTTGAMAGGTSVTLTGTGLGSATQVYFGGVPATSFTINSSTSITAVAPPQAAGTVDVTVQTPYGTSPAYTLARFTYLAATPSITSLSATSGTSAGGVTVTISGSDLTGTRQVLFGTIPADFVVNDDSSITATSPVQAAGTIDVPVVTPWGTSATGTQTHFTVSAAPGVPTVTALSSSSGATGGGNTITLTGTNFTDATSVAFGGLTATSYTVNSSTSITAVVPRGAAGTVNVTVTNASGTAASASANQYTFSTATPAVSALSAASGPTTGGDIVTITGTNLDGATAVSFGGTAATSFAVLSPTTISAVVPALSAATHHVTVTTPGGTSSTTSADQFQAVSAAVPEVGSLGTTSGTTAGGTTVVLTGTGFTGATAVMFGGVAATSFTVNSDTQITATSPAQADGDVQVTVTTAAGTSSDATYFTYTAPVPAVTSLGTTSGPMYGGTVVTITGSGFTGATDVSFGGTAATFFTVNSDTSISAVSPFAPSGTAHVTVTTAGGPSTTGSGDVFTFTTSTGTTPTLTGLSASSGPSIGGTTVTITGTNLGGATSVMFGDVAASFTVVSSTTISAVAPPGTSGDTVDVVVYTPLGFSATGTSSQFTYASAVPTVTALSASTGTTAGGATITITGTNFGNVQGVAFGGQASPSFTVLSPTSISAVVPVNAAGVMHVTVTNDDGTSSTSSADQYTYSSTSSTPTVTSLGTSSGPTGGGTSVTITGTNFSGVTNVFFGTLPSASFTVTSSTSITAVAPAQAAGAVDLTVLTGAGLSASSSSDVFTYNGTAPSVSALDVSSGPTGGGTTVTLTGANLNGATAVTFGSTTATSFTVDSPTQITATAPAGSAGSAHVTVTTPYGTSSTSSADLFTYLNAPTVTALSVSSGLGSGGTSVTITGTNFSGLVSVAFGSVDATSFTVTSSTSITATSPAAQPGDVNVVVTTALGASPASSANLFTYEPPVPTVSALAQTAGPLGGGNSVTITGTGFTDATDVKFGTTSATFSVDSPTQITATAPTGSAGTVDVTVSSISGTSSAVTADHYTYQPAPTLTSLSASTDTASGGIPITITGTNFTGVTAVSFGSSSATFTVNSSTSITATVPAHAAGSASVSVTTPGGVSNTASFTYTSANTVTWTGGSSGSWGTGSNWSGGSAPTSTDDVVIPTGSAVTFSSGTGAAHRLNVSGSLTVSGGTLTVNAQSSIDTLTVSGGTMDGAGAVTVGTSFSWSGGTLASTSDLTIGASATGTISGTSVTRSGGAAIKNKGALTFTGDNINLSSAGINNYGTFTASRSSGTQTFSGNGTFNNIGTLTKTGAGTTSFGPTDFTSNPATVAVNGGVLSLSLGFMSGTATVASGAELQISGTFQLLSTAQVTGAGTLRITGGTTTLGGTISVSGGVIINSGATAQGTGTISTNLTNNGTLIVGTVGSVGILAITGNFTQGSTGTLKMDINGTGAGTGYDQLQVSGTVTLGGTLNVSVSGSYAPGTQFTLITYAGSSGSFSSITGAGTMTPQYGPFGFKLLALADVPGDDVDDAPKADQQPKQGEKGYRSNEDGPGNAPRRWREDDAAPAVVVVSAAAVAAPQDAAFAWWRDEQAAGEGGFSADASAGDGAGEADLPSLDQLLALPLALLKSLLSSAE
jgi:hypothetical protein